LRTKNTITVITLFFISVIILNNALFLHLHLLPDGQLIEHAHPYKSVQDEKGKPFPHKHSHQEYIFISFINNLFSQALLVWAAVFSANMLLYFFKKSAYQLSLYARVILQGPSRAPPF